MKPWPSRRIPAASGVSASVFGTRPTADSRCDPSSCRPSPSARMVSRMRPPSAGSTRTGVVEGRIVIPSSRKIAATSSETSSSSIVIRRGATWMMVTSLPNRRNILSAAARLISEARAGDHRLGRGAPPVDADPSELGTLDERHLLAGLRQLYYWEETAALVVDPLVVDSQCEFADLD